MAISYQRVRERLWRTGYRDLASQCTLLALCLDAEPEALELFLMWNVALPKDIHERFSRWIAKGMPLDRSAVQHRTDRRRPWFAVGDDSNSNPRSR
ncbi:MAG: hypothetical protein P4M00_07045 [Azospirillaceae bacterium]|nr:hypothetical protein [Azospirillaceae bacterium]